MHNINNRDIPTTAQKIAAKHAVIASQQGNDTNSASGIQTWSRFVPESTEDYDELGFIHGSNGQPRASFSYLNRQAGIAYNQGYNRGQAAHKPF